MMQEALHAAVARMNNGNGSADSRAAPSMDTIGTLMQFVPKLLQNNEAGPEMLEKLDALQKGDLTTLRTDMQVLRKQCYRTLKAQEQLLAKVDELQKQHTAVAHAVLDLAHQMARISLIDDGDDDEDYDRNHRRADARANRARTRQKAARNMDTTRP
jgi:uncharacterized protein HemY